MRVYIAIDFDDKIKDYFVKVTSCIKSHCVEGSFTEKNNFHLTIRFIGEIDDFQVMKIKEIIDKAVLKASTFELMVTNLGIFKRKKTNILWIGVQQNDVLSKLHNDFSNLLKESKIPFYDKLFMPHITLGRRVLFYKDSLDLNNLIDFEKINIPVKSISLMASKEINGKLNGVSIYTANLKHISLN